MKKLNAFVMIFTVIMSVFTVSTMFALPKNVISKHTLYCCASPEINCLISRKGNMALYKEGVNCGINPTPISLNAPPPIPTGYTEYNEIFIPSATDPTHGTGYKGCTIYINVSTMEHGDAYVHDDTVISNNISYTDWVATL